MASAEQRGWPPRWVRWKGRWMLDELRASLVQQQQQRGAHARSGRARRVDLSSTGRRTFQGCKLDY